MSKTYYFHTTKLDVTKEGKVPASTIALEKVGDTIYYGVSICSKYDNFSRKYGREVATNRLQQNFGTIRVLPSYAKRFESENDLCLDQLFTLVKSVVLHNRKWKKRITRFNLDQKKGAKVVQLNSQN